MYKCILLDLDGTLIDPKEGITKAVAHSLSCFGIKVEDLDTLCKFIGPPLRDSFADYYGFDREKAELAVEKYREYFSVKGIYQHTLYEGVPQLLKNLQDEGKTIILATSKPTIYAAEILRYYKIDSAFTFVSGSEFDGSRAVKKDIIEFALQQNNINDLDSVVMVGDREHDIIGAKLTGVASIGVCYGYGGFDELQEAGADKIVNSIEELSAFLTAADDE